MTSIFVQALEYSSEIATSAKKFAPAGALQRLPAAIDYYLKSKPCTALLSRRLAPLRGRHSDAFT
jgi:hypothetical protein